MLEVSVTISSECHDCMNTLQVHTSFAVEELVAALQNAAYDSEVPATGLTRRSPGLNPTTITRLTDECATWVEECHNRFDEQVCVQT